MECCHFSWYFTIVRETQKKNATYILSLSVYYYNKLQNFFFSFVIINIVGVAVLLFNLFPIGPKYVWYFSHAWYINHVLEKKGLMKDCFHTHTYILFSMLLHNISVRLLSQSKMSMTFLIYFKEKSVPNPTKQKEKQKLWSYRFLLVVAVHDVKKGILNHLSIIFSS